MEIVCPPGIPKKLCLERSRLLHRLTMMERTVPLPQSTPPPEEVVAPVGPVNPAPVVPIYNPTVKEIAGKWPKGDDVRVRVKSYPVVYGPGDDQSGMFSSNRPIEVSDLMGGYGLF